jgi:hypothetical protein
MKKTIIMIISSGHSGSTLLDKSIGASDECFSLGEIINLNEEFNIATHTHCGCGEKLIDCRFWGEILKNFNELLSLDLLSNTNDFDIRFKRRSILKTLYNLILPTYSKDCIRIAENNRILFESIFAETKAKILIDSSKSIDRALLLRKYLPEYKFVFIHLVRNGLAVLNSYRKDYYKLKLLDKKTQTVTEEVYKVKKSEINIITKSWIKLNLKMILISIFISSKDCQLIKFESFTRNPEAILRIISEKFQIKFNEKMVRLDNDHNHIIGGNSSRINAKSIEYKPLNEFHNLIESDIKFFTKRAGWLNRFFGYK